MTGGCCPVLHIALSAALVVADHASLPGKRSEEFITPTLRPLRELSAFRWRYVTLSA